MTSNVSDIHKTKKAPGLGWNWCIAWTNVAASAGQQAIVMVNAPCVDGTSVSFEATGASMTRGVPDIPFATTVRVGHRIATSTVMNRGSMSMTVEWMPIALACISAKLEHA